MAMTPTTTVEQLATRAVARKSLDAIKAACRAETQPGYVCRIDLWFELLWYAYQPDTGICATAFYNSEAIGSVVYQFAAYMECEPGEVTWELI